MEQDDRVAAIQKLLLRVAFVGCVLSLLLITLVAKFKTIQSPPVFDHAVIARNLATGHGLTHSVISPLGLAIAPEHAEQLTFSAPLYPIILSVPIRLFGATDRMIALTSVTFAALTLALLYFICMKYLSNRIAVAATGLSAITVPFVMHAVSGTEVPCLALLVTGLFGVLLAWRRAESEKQRSRWWAAAASVIIALCWLTRYEMVALIPCVALFWLLADPSRIWSRLLWTVLPFIIIATPWVVRNSLVMERPIVSDYSYTLLSTTVLYPQDLILRMYREAPYHPWAVAIEHPGMILLKAHARAMQLYYSVPLLGNPYITALFIFGVLISTVRRDLAALHWALVLSIVLTAGAMCFYFNIDGLLSLFLPIVAVFGIKTFSEILETVDWPAPPDDDEASPFALYMRMRLVAIQKRGPGRVAKLGMWLVILSLAYPMLDYLFIQPPARENPVAIGAEALRDEPYQLIMSDIPSLVSWYSGKRTLMLPGDRWNLAAIEKIGVKPDAVFLKPGPQAERAIFPGYERVEDWKYPGVLLERLPGEMPPPQGTPPPLVNE